MSSDNPFRLFLLRHGNTFHEGEIAYQVGSKTNLCLTEKGLSQAQTFSDYLSKQGLHPHAIYCGSLQRQTQTAHIIHEKFPEAKLNSEEIALDEIDYGCWEGLTTKEIESRWPIEYRDWHAIGIWPRHIFGSQQEEHLTQLQQWIDKLRTTTPPGGFVVGVSSNGIFKLLLKLIPAFWENLVQNKRVNEYKVGTGNFCEILIHNHALTIESWNCQPHPVAESSAS